MIGNYKPTLFNWYGYDLSKSSSLKKLIKKLERLIRNSPEYKIWADECRKDYDRCPRCNTPSEIDPLEVHHTPETLFDIVENKITALLKEDEEKFIKFYKPIDIVKIILDMHLNNEVSYEVLCSSCHKREHNERKIKKETKNNLYE